MAGGEFFSFVLPPIGKLSVSIVTAQLLMLEGFTLGKPSELGFWIVVIGRWGDGVV